MNKPAPTAHPDTRRPVGGSQFLGSVETNGCHAWRGIRYAAPPVGPLRWRAPQPLLSWPGIVEALQHGPVAPQYAGKLAPVPAALHGQLVGEEDCLSLNVFAPACSPVQVPRGHERRPVMVWIHGGGNAVGGSAGYDVAGNLAAQDDVIVVTVNYRLGVLGWFAHPDLQAEPGLSDDERSGNFALLDLIAALRWVRDHIEAFGGDPGCVTVFGESAGGQNVLLLLASPLAAGLFHRAIAQSPVCESFSMDEAQHGLDSPLESRRSGALVIGRRLLNAAGRQDLPPARMAEWLRMLSPAELLAAQIPGSEGIYLGPRPVRDGTVLPLTPLPELFAKGQWNRVPVLIGSNRDEYRTFLAGKPEHCRLLAGKLPILRERTAYLVESGLLSRAWRAHHVDRPADAMLRSGHTEVWSYRFDWDEAPALPFIRPDLLLGAAHAMEMPFVFRDEAGEFDLFQVNTPFNRAGRLQLCRAMGTAWVTFARQGEPRLPDGTAWLRRGPQGEESLVFDTARDGGLRMAAMRESLERIKRELLEDELARLPAPLRLRAFARVFLWSPLFVGHATEVEYEVLRQQLGLNDPASAHRPQMEI
ncbi:carboxylesterase family protein [Paucibacter sp. PLA-PC-4]|uniref:carboxylesterase/lipase family protein n=1 Tax=Paucibacter sp. PLA-PC-4 TaxID=2993655 RepID=UPI002248CFDC|nr:carboxylesterase family protein [Paucibacter sp. PLA-PC-4]MCX2863357.1 carboxylesterase family protein [Paucibacter sp. PLA-PC-4]